MIDFIIPPKSLFGIAVTANGTAGNSDEAAKYGGDLQLLLGVAERSASL